MGLWQYVGSDYFAKRTDFSTITAQHFAHVVKDWIMDLENASLIGKQGVFQLNLHAQHFLSCELAIQTADSLSLNPF